MKNMSIYALAHVEVRTYLGHLKPFEATTTTKFDMPFCIRATTHFRFELLIDGHSIR